MSWLFSSWQVTTRPGRHVRDAHRRVGRVDALAAVTGRAVDIDPQIVVVDLDVDLLGFRQHRDARRAGVDSALAFRHRHALHAMDAALVAEVAVGALAPDLEDDLAESSPVGLGGGEDSTFQPIRSAYLVYIR